MRHLILIGVFLQIGQLIVSIKHRHALRDRTGDPWHGRTLEWSVSSPAPFIILLSCPLCMRVINFGYTKKSIWRKVACIQRICIISPFICQKIHRQDLLSPCLQVSWFCLSMAYVDSRRSWIFWHDYHMDCENIFNRYGLLSRCRDSEKQRNWHILRR